jgi:hypothetical protein
MRHGIISVTRKQSLSKGDIIRINDMTLRVRTIRQKGNKITVLELGVRK